MPKKPRVKAGTSKSAAAARRRTFAQAYIANGRNATEAAITAGFNPASAQIRGCELVKDRNVSELIADLTSAHEKATGLTTESVLREVRRIALSDARRLFRDDGTILPVHEMDDDTAAMVGSIESLEEFSGTGEDRKLSGHTKKLKLWDKPRALDMAMKHLGLYEKDNAQIAKPVTIKMVFE